MKILFFAGSRVQAEAFTALFLRQWLKGKAHELDALREAVEGSAGWNRSGRA